MPFQAYYLASDGHLETGLDQDGIERCLASREGTLWVDIMAAEEGDRLMLERVFGFHHLAIEDCLSRRVHTPKIDDFGAYLFVIVHGVNHSVEADVVETAEMALFLGGNYVVSSHNTGLYGVDAVKRQLETNMLRVRKGADFLMHSLVDALVDNVEPTIERMSEVADVIEEDIVRRPEQSSLDAIMRLRRSAMRIHRVMAPQRETLNRLSKGEFDLLRPETHIFYRDIYDHAARIEDMNQMVLDRAQYAMNTYLSSVANRQNEIMKVLSMVATIILPLTLVTGIYGMNFHNMPELDWAWGYYAVLGLMAGVAALWMYVFWMRRWITWGGSKKSPFGLFSVDPAKVLGHIGNLRKPSGPGRHP